MCWVGYCVLFGLPLQDFQRLLSILSYFYLIKYSGPKGGPPRPPMTSPVLEGPCSARGQTEQHWQTTLWTMSPRHPWIPGGWSGHLSAVLLSGLSVMPSVSGTLVRTQATVPPSLVLVGGKVSWPIFSPCLPATWLFRAACMSPFLQPSSWAPLGV